MSSLGRGWRPLQALLLPSSPRYASFTLTRYSCVVPLPHGRRGLATATKVKAKRAPRKKAETTKTTKTTKTPAEKEANPPEGSCIPILSLAALRDLAVLCGRNSSGTRAALRADLEEAMDGDSLLAEGEKTRILSIDMGVRNLAYCLLEVRSSPKSPPKLVAWERLSLIGGPEKEANESSAASGKVPASAFSPPAMAAVAARLIRDRLLPLRPTHILIERQRFRSGGGAAVLEWTVRVNSLEAMLHGIFAYRQMEVDDAKNTVEAVQAVSPQRASRFLLQGGMGAGHPKDLLPPKTRKTKEKDIKDVKEAFVAGLLRDQTPKPITLTYDEAIRGMVDAFLVRWDAKQSRGRPKTAEGKAEKKSRPAAKAAISSKITLSKIDDLADCVAQGLIWLQWEGNKTALRTKGAEDLLATKQLTG